ncbi:MAG: tetratricopeptide repeat protein [candidate division WOR-3 bacterium]
MRKGVFVFMFLFACTPLYRQAGVVDPDFVMANRLHQEGRVAESLSFYRSAVAKEPRNPIYLYYYGIALAETGDTARAIEAFGTILRTNPGDALAADALGSIYLARGEAKEAIAVYNALERANPSYRSMARVRKARAYLMISEPDSLYREATGALRESPFSPEAWYLLACFYCKRGDRDNALRALENAIDLDGSLRKKARIDEAFSSLAGDPVFKWMTRED